MKEKKIELNFIYFKIILKIIFGMRFGNNLVYFSIYLKMFCIYVKFN